MKRICGLIFGAALAAAFAADGATYTNFYLTQNTSQHFVGDVEVGGNTYKAYAISDGEKWAVLTARDKTQARLDVPASVTLAATDYPVRAVSPSDSGSVGGYLWGRDSTLCEAFLTNGVVEIGESALTYCKALTNLVLGTSLRSIGNSAFAGNPKLQSLELPEGLLRMGENVFERCEALTSITLPTGLQTIGRSAFQNCTKLSSITIPDGVTELPQSAFSSCRSLTSVTLPSGLRSIGEYAFQYCESLQKINLPAAVTTIGGAAFADCKALKSITIPDGVTAIAANAFQRCSALTTVTLPSTITEIGNYAFDGCTTLATINLPNTVTRIGQYAFQNCPALTSLDWPSSLATVDAYAFAGCAHLTAATIPASVTTIGEGAFRSCAALATFTVASGNPSYTVREGLLCKKDGGTIVAAPGTLTELRIPDGVGVIRPYAFSACSALTKIHIPLSVTNLGANAFWGCDKIADVTTPGHRALNSFVPFSAYQQVVTNVTVLAGTKKLANEFCRSCRKLQKVTLPDSLRHLGLRGFCECENLVDIELPAAVTNLGESAFSSCSSLTNLVVPAGVTQIPQHCFNYCRKLESVTIPDGVTEIGDYAFGTCEKLTAITLPSPLQSLGRNAFYCCYELTEIEVPDGVRKIDQQTFAYCKKLWRADLPEGITSIGEQAFISCPLLSAFQLPGALQSLGAHAFHYCKSLSAITVPEGVTGIPDYTFAECYGLQSVKLPTTLSWIGNRAFYNCSLLQSVKLPAGLQSLAGTAFEQCKSLGEINIPAATVLQGSPYLYGTYKLEAINVADDNESCSSIWGSLFNKSETQLLWVPYLCTSLYIPSNVTSVSTSLFSDRPRLDKISVSPDNPSYASKDGILYTKDMKQILFAGRGLTSVEIADDCTDLPKEAFKYCTGLRTLSVPPQIAPLMTYFNPCYKDLTSVTLKGTPTEVPDQFCRGCTALADITLPDTVTRIGKYAFHECKTLTSFTVPTGVTEIGEWAFGYCDALRMVALPPNLTHLGNNAFYQSKCLDYLELPPSVTYVGTNALATATDLKLLMEGPPPGNIAQAGLSIGDTVLRPRAYSNEWATAGLDDRVKLLDLPEEGVTWTADTTLDWPSQDHVCVHKGVIAEDEIWTPDKTHVIYGWVTVSNGVTVTARKGTVVKFCDGMGLLIRNGGTFVGESVTFTHIRDDEVGGDSDRDSGFNPPKSDAYKIYGRVVEDDETRYRCNLIKRAGNIGDETWTAGNVYYLKDGATIPKGQTLTVEAGAIVKLGFYTSLTVKGTLDVRGTRSNPVIFTSCCDDEHGGDNDGTGDDPGEQCWKSICISDLDAVANISYATFRYGGGRQAADHAPNYVYGCIRAENGETTLDGCTFADCFWGGIQMLGGKVTAQNCLFAGNSGCAVYSHGGEVSVANSVIYNCAGTVGDQKSTSGGKVTFRNCIVHTVANWESDFAGVAAYDHCCFHNRTDGDSACRWVGDNGNIATDPLLRNPAEGDFRIGDASPCVDAGSAAAPTRDYWGQTRQNVVQNPTGGRNAKGRYPDIGLYEVIPLAGALDAPDLEAFDVIAPKSFGVGERITVAYRVRNVSDANGAKGETFDRVDFITESGAVYAGASRWSVVDLPGGSKDALQREMTFAVPAMPVGAVWARVTVNANRDIFEGLQTQNNVAKSGELTLRVVETTFAALVGGGAITLQPGAAYSCHLTGGAGVPANTLVVIRTTGGADLTVTTGADRMPTDTYRHSVSEKMADGLYFVTLPEGEPYVTFQNNGTSAVELTLEDRGAGLMLFDQGIVTTNFNANVPHPEKAAKQYAEEGHVKTNDTAVFVAIRFWGNRFADDMDVALVKDDATVAPIESLVFSEHSGYANFDVTGAQPGLYDLQVTVGGNSVRLVRVCLYDPNDYVASGQTALLVKRPDKKIEYVICGIPSALRAGHTYKGSVYWRNNLDTELEAPVVQVCTKLSTVRPNSSYGWGRDFKFVALSRTRPVTRLKPYEVGKFDFEFQATLDSDQYLQALNLSILNKCAHGQMPDGGIPEWRGKSSGGPKNFAMNHAVKVRSYPGYTTYIVGYLRTPNGSYPLYATVPDPLDWDSDSFSQYNRTEDMNDDHWNLLKARLREVYGEDQMEALSRYREVAEDIAFDIGPSDPVPPVMVDATLRTDINRIVGNDPVLRRLATEVDLRVAGRGAPLDVSRTYETGMGSRQGDGMFGRGWHSPLETRLVKETDVVYVGIPGCPKVAYTRGVGTTYENAMRPGYDRVEGNRLVNRDGSYAVFRASDGLLEGVYDVRGRGIAITYEDNTNRIVRIDHTDGKCLLFTYDGDVVTRVKDNSLCRFADYVYDTLDGKKMLVAVTNAYGKGTSYAYHPADATPASRSLARIAPGGEAALDYAWDDAGRIASITRGGKFVTEFVRPDGRTVKVIEPNGAVTTFEIGARNNILSVTEPDGAKTKIVYDAEGVFPVAYESQTGKRTLVSYNGPGDIIGQTLPGGGKVTYGYTTGGQLEQIVDPDGKVRKFAYNAQNEIHSANAPDGVSRYYSYDDDGDLRSVLYEGRQHGLDLAYDANHDLIAVAATNTDRRITIERTDTGLLTKATDSTSGSTRINYSNYGGARVDSFVSNGRERRFAYDVHNRVTALTDKDGNGEGYAYDDLGRLKTVKALAGGYPNGTTYLTNVYDDGANGTGKLKREVYGNGVSMTFAYDTLGRVTAMTTTDSGGKVLSDYRLVYDGDGKITSICETVGGNTHTFGYDVDGQLVLAKYADDTQQAFGYDASGNLRGLVYNTSYDPETGSLLRLADTLNGTTLCGYDEFGRLNGVTNATRGVNWSCEYDAFGGRVRVTDGLVTTERVNMPGTNRLLDEYEGGVCVRHHVWANGRRIAVVRSGRVRYLHCDHLCSVRQVTDELGNVTGTAEFRAFGETASSSGADASLCGWIAALGVETDPTGFLFMGRRYYSIQLAKFISEDPIGIAGGDFNFRRYCFNDPIGLFDPLGLSSLDCRGFQGLKDLCDLSGALLGAFAAVAIVCAAPAAAVVLGVAALGVAIAGAAVSAKMNGGLQTSDYVSVGLSAAGLAGGSAAASAVSNAATAASLGTTADSWRTSGGYH